MSSNLSIHDTLYDVNNKKQVEVDLLLLVDSLPEEIVQHILAYKSHVFKKKSELQEAVGKYLKEDPRFQLMEHWDVSQVEDFEPVFDAMRGHYRRIPSYKENSSWENSWKNVSGATNVDYAMFGYSRFNSDRSRCTMWKVRNNNGRWEFAYGRFGVSEGNVGNTATNLPDLFQRCVSFGWGNIMSDEDEDLYLDGMFYGCIAFRSDISFPSDVSFRPRVSNWFSSWIVIEHVIYMDETSYGCTLFRSDDSSEHQDEVWDEFHRERARKYAATYQNETLNGRYRAWKTKEQRAWRLQQSFCCSLAAALVFCLMYVIGTLRFVALCFAAGLFLIGIDHI